MTMKKLLMTVCLLAAGLSATAQTSKEDLAMRMAVAYPETDVVKNPSARQLAGMWQIAGVDRYGYRRGSFGFKILQEDGTFYNLFPSGRSMFFSRGGQGRWSVKDGKLVEKVEQHVSNTFAGKTNQMELRLSEHGKVMHLTYKNADSTIVNEYWVKVE